MTDPSPENKDQQPPSATRADSGTTLSLSPNAAILAPDSQRIGRYQLRRLLGKGGMGCVYLALDTQMQREVALKVPNFRADEDPAVLERFYREARTAGRLRHPNICPVFDVDRVEGIHYLTMAFIEGQPLAQYIDAFAARPPQD